MKLLSGGRAFSELEQRAHLDLAARARGGIVIYLAAWLTSAIWAGIFQISPLFFIANTLILVVIALMRLAHYHWLHTDPTHNTRRVYQLLVGVLLFNALYWGCLSGWIIAGDRYTELYYPYMIVLAAFGAGGAAVLSISKVVSIAFPLLTLSPTVLLLLINGGREDILMAILAVFAILYVLTASRIAREDYWSAIASQKIAEDQARVMEELSITDQLTQLHNRMYFENRFIEEWDRCGRLNVPMAIFLVDLDHFKLINDTYGHAAGDACLTRVAAVLRNEMKRSIDTVARYGGEEFVIMISVTDMKALPILADRLVRAVAAIDLRWREEPVALTCSVGLAATIPSRAVDKEKLLIAADKALYQAKAEGRNRYRVFIGGGTPKDVEINAINVQKKVRRDSSNGVTETETGLTFA